MAAKWFNSLDTNSRTKYSILCNKAREFKNGSAHQEMFVKVNVSFLASVGNKKSTTKHIISVKVFCRYRKLKRDSLVSSLFKLRQQWQTLVAGWWYQRKHKSQTKKCAKYQYIVYTYEMQHHPWKCIPLFSMIWVLLWWLHSDYTYWQSKYFELCPKIYSCKKRRQIMSNKPLPWQIEMVQCQMEKKRQIAKRTCQKVRLLNQLWVIFWFLGPGAFRGSS